jgi:glycosyltransferase involved in cell wall biosynthesis
MRFFPQTAAKPFQVIEHGRDFNAFGQVGHFPTTGERVRVLVPGNISGSKGARILASMQALDHAGRFEFHVLGKAARELANLPNVVCHGPYDRTRFGEIVARIQPHLGVVLSIWAETFCHTLTEMWACGLPVAAFDLGAVGDRIRQHGGGWLIADVSPEAALAALVSIVSDRSGFSARLRELAAWRDGAGAEQTCAWMSDRYDALYRQLLAQTRPSETAGRVEAGDPPPALYAQAPG